MPKLLRLPIMLLMTACLSLTACQRPFGPDAAMEEAPQFHFPTSRDSLPISVVWLTFSGNGTRTIELPSGEYVVPPSRLSLAARVYITNHLNEMFGHLGVAFVDGTPNCPNPVQIMFGGIGTADLQLGGYTVPAHNTSAVFTDVLRFGVPPIWLGEQDFALGVANVAAHEFGHQLGAKHVDDPDDIMWGTPDMTIFLRSQKWKPASQGAGWTPHPPVGCQ